MLPASYSHVFVPDTHRLAADAATRELDRRLQARPTRASRRRPESAGNGVLWAADVWHSVKKHWAIEAQRLDPRQARRATRLGGAAESEPTG